MEIYLRQNGLLQNPFENGLQGHPLLTIPMHPRIPRGDFARYIVDVASEITLGYPRMIR